MDEDFEVTYYVDDGYAGSGGSPHTITVSAERMGGGESDKTLSAVFQKLIRDDFQSKCRPYSEDESRFIAWAKSLRTEDPEEPS